MHWRQGYNLGWLRWRCMNRDRLRELILLLAIGSALTVAVLALWLLPFKVVRDVSLSFRRS
jgi:hypothetical protein